jgi:uncharacterized protein (TIGR03083 family)
MTVRTAYVDTLPVLRDLLAASAGHWDEPSAVAEMTVGALAGHAARAAFTVQRYLAVPEPPGVQRVLDAPGYFVALPGLGEDIDSDFQRAIRDRAAAEAADGPSLLLDRFDGAVEALATALPETPPDRHIVVLDGLTLLLDDYLVTRLIEVVVHGDDLAASLAMPAPEFSSDVTDRVIGCLVEVAVRTHGSMAVVRALTRRERDLVEALRVL